MVNKYAHWRGIRVQFPKCVINTERAKHATTRQASRQASGVRGHRWGVSFLDSGVWFLDSGVVFVCLVK